MSLSDRRRKKLLERAARDGRINSREMSRLRDQGVSGIKKYARRNDVNTGGGQSGGGQSSGSGRFAQNMGEGPIGRKDIRNLQNAGLSNEKIQNRIIKGGHKAEKGVQYNYGQDFHDRYKEANPGKERNPDYLAHVISAGGQKIMMQDGKPVSKSGEGWLGKDGAPAGRRLDPRSANRLNRYLGKNGYTLDSRGKAELVGTRQVELKRDTRLGEDGHRREWGVGDGGRPDYARNSMEYVNIYKAGGGKDRKITNKLGKDKKSKERPEHGGHGGHGGGGEVPDTPTYLDETDYGAPSYDEQVANIPEDPYLNPGFRGEFRPDLEVQDGSDPAFQSNLEQIVGDLGDTQSGARTLDRYMEDYGDDYLKGDSGSASMREAESNPYVDRFLEEGGREASSERESAAASTGADEFGGWMDRFVADGSRRQEGTTSGGQSSSGGGADEGEDVLDRWERRLSANRMFSS